MTSIPKGCQARTRTYLFARLLHLTVASIPFATPVAHADQWVNTYNMRAFDNLGAAQFDVMMSNMLQDQIYMRKLKEAAQKRAKTSTGDTAASAPAPPAYKYPLNATDFTPTSSRAVPEQLAAISATSEERAQLTAVYREIQQRIEANPEVRKNNLATAVTILLGSSVQVVSQRMLGDSESVDLLRTVNDAIVSTVDFRGMTDQQRTDAYDLFLITGGLIAALDASAKETRDPVYAPLAKELAQNVLDQFGINAVPSGSEGPATSRNLGQVTGASAGSTRQHFADGMLDGIYTGLAKGLTAGASGGIDIGVAETYVTFYPDGKVYRRVPEGGLEGWDRADAEARVPELWGTYRPISPGRWEVRWNESVRVGMVEREDAGLRFEDAKLYPVATCEGLRLHGIYARPNWRDRHDPPSITLTASGDFVDYNQIGELAYQNVSNPQSSAVIGPGLGAYHIGRNTLHLEYSDGRRVSVEIHARPADIEKDPIPVIYVNGWELVRVP